MPLPGRLTEEARWLGGSVPHPNPVHLDLSLGQLAEHPVRWETQPLMYLSSNLTIF